VNDVVFSCPFNEITIRRGKWEDNLSIFDAIFEWYEQSEYSRVQITKKENCIIATFDSEDGYQQLLNGLTEYFLQRILIKELNEIISMAKAPISDNVKDTVFVMMSNIMERFTSSFGMLLHWSLQRYFQNNSQINVDIYEKLNLKVLMKDMESIVRGVHVLNYFFDSLARTMSVEYDKDFEFLSKALIAKSQIEHKKEFMISKDEDFHIWIKHGKIQFGNERTTFGTKELLCTETLNSGISINNLSTLKIVTLAMLCVSPSRVILHNSTKTEKIKEYIANHEGLFGEIEIVIDNNSPNF
jgi:hypothetical protein